MKMLTCDHSRTRQLSITISVWLAVLTVAGLGLIIYGVFQEEKIDYKKLNIGVGTILLICMLIFASFIIIETKKLRKYILHVLVPWFFVITIIVIGTIVAFVVHFINFKLFLITSLPLFSLAFFTFNEIYHYIGRMRVTPMIHNYRTPRLDGTFDTSPRRARTSSRLIHFRPDTTRGADTGRRSDPTRPRTQQISPKVQQISKSQQITPTRPTSPKITRTQPVSPARSTSRQVSMPRQTATSPLKNLIQRTPMSTSVQRSPTSSPSVQRSPIKSKKSVLPPLPSATSMSQDTSRLSDKK